MNVYTERQVHGGQSLFQHAEYYFTQSFNDYYFYCELWTGENSPIWIFDNGVYHL